MALTMHALGLGAAILYAVLVSWPAAVVGYLIVLSSEVTLAYVSRPFGLPISAGLNGWNALIAVLVAIGAAFWAGAANGIVLIAGSALILQIARTFSYQRTGALTPVSLSVTGLVVEAFTLSYMQKVSLPLGQ